MKVARGAEFMRTMFKKVAAALAAFNAPDSAKAETIFLAFRNFMGCVADAFFACKSHLFLSPAQSHAPNRCLLLWHLHEQPCPQGTRYRMRPHTASQA
jgi:hypothetical protein